MEPLSPNEYDAWNELVLVYPIGAPVPLTKILGTIAGFNREHKRCYTPRECRRFVRSFKNAGLLTEAGEFSYALSNVVPAVMEHRQVAMKRGRFEQGYY